MNIKPLHHTAIILMAVLSLAGCLAAPEDRQSSEQGGFTTEVNTPEPGNPSPTIEPEGLSKTTNDPGNGSPIIHHQIDAVLDYSAKALIVEQTITIDGMLTQAEEMALIVEPNRYPRGFELETLEVDQQSIEWYSLDGNQLRFRLPESVYETGNAAIRLSYRLQLPEIPLPSDWLKPQPYGYTERQLNLVDWYVLVPPLDENNVWIIHKPPVFGEALVYPAASVAIDLTIENYQIPLSIASSSPALQAENTYSFTMKLARTFAISISPSYSILEGETNGVKVRSYAFAGYEVQNQAVMQYAIEALAWFTELYGPLPHESVSIVQADFLDGMEYGGLYFVSKSFYDLYDGTVQGYLSLITVHEMAHQWWFSVVGSDQALEPWLDEGLATFGELQYIERYHPELEDWWWAYRVNYYEPVGAIDLAIYDYPTYEGYRNAVYLRGATFLYELRGRVGEEAFQNGMKEYYTKNRGRVANGREFMEAIQHNTSQSLENILAAYFDNYN